MSFNIIYTGINFYYTININTQPNFFTFIFLLETAMGLSLHDIGHLISNTFSIPLSFKISPLELARSQFCLISTIQSHLYCMNSKNNELSNLKEICSDLTRLCLVSYNFCPLLFGTLNLRLIFIN